MLNSELGIKFIVSEMKGLEGLSIDEKYEIEEYRDMMKAFAAAATEGNLDQASEVLTTCALSYFP